jgi:Flp pilus assembly pilin Flp
MQLFSQMWKEEDGVISFEWTLLITLLTFGIVSGIAAARDAIIDEFGDAAQAMLSIDQSYTVDFPLLIQVHTASTSSASDSSFTDALIYTDCGRGFLANSQTALEGPGGELDDIDS